MKINRKLFLLIIILLSNIFVYCQDNEQDTILQDTVVIKLIVGIKQSPPFIIKQGNFYTGLSIDLWEQIANELQIIYEYKEYEQNDFSQMLTDIENNAIDVCINPLTVTSERLNRFDFTLPFFSSNMVTVVRNDKKLNIFKFFSNFFSVKIFSLLGALLFIIIIFGLIIWLVERKKNSQFFRRNYNGIADGIWWTTVTMTTVGYGDKYPRSVIGKILGIIWMFFSIVFFSTITGTIAASLTVNQISSQEIKIDDLKKMNIGTMPGSSSEEFLVNHNFASVKTNFNTISEGLLSVSDEKIDAFVYDEAIVKFIINQLELNNSIYISPYKMNAIYYSFSVPSNSPLLKEINPILIKELESVYWIGILNKYDLNN